jgi:hypothetical protein
MPSSNCIPWLQIGGSAFLLAEAFVFWLLQDWDLLKAGEEYFQKPSVRAIFPPKLSSILIPLLWGTGLGMLALSLAYESLHLPIEGVMYLSYAFFLSGALWSAAAWLSSKTLLKISKAFTRSWHYRRIKWGVIAAILVALCACEYAVYWTKYHIELNRLDGRLEPACEPFPKGICGFPSLPEGKAIAIEFGDGTTAIAGGFPTMVIASRQFGPVLGIIRPDNQDDLAIYMDIHSKDGKIIARFDEKGKFIVNQENKLFMERPDKSSLRVVDEYGNEVLNVQYLNKELMKISGIIQLPGREPFIIGLSPWEDSFGCVSNGGNDRTISILIP